MGLDPKAVFFHLPLDHKSDRDPRQHEQLDLFCIALTFQPTFILPEQINIKDKKKEGQGRTLCLTRAPIGAFLERMIEMNALSHVK